MCTQARLVQAGQASEWHGMPMTDGQGHAYRFKLEPDQPATLEVTIDPAAHGPQGVGPFLRGITITTNDGKEYDFEMKGTIVR
ncbi:MAG: hypothetical protein ACYC3S_10295 [Chloroflexota bacterium]